MKRQDLIFSTLFFLAGVFSRLPFLPKVQSHPDSPSFSIALIRYTFEQDTPAPPGYPLYFGLAKLILYIFGDPYLSLILVSVLFSGIGAVAFFLVGKSFFNRPVGLISALLFLSAPTFYFFGLTVYPYLVVAVMTTLIAWLVYEIALKRKRYGFLLGFIYAVHLGIRPQELLLTLPLFLFGLYNLSFKERLKSLTTFAIAFALWFIPFLFIVGGIEKYFFFSSRAASSALPHPSLTLFWTQRFILASGLYLTFGIGIILLVIFLIKQLLRYIKNLSILRKERKKILFFAAWFIPPLLFNLFVRTDHAGYQIGYLTFFLFVVALAIWKLCKERIIFVCATTFLVVSFNLFLFFYDRDPNYVHPYRQTSFHYSDLARNDYVLSKKINFIKRNYPHEKTIVVIGPVFWKQVMYYLPDYQVYEIDALFTENPDLKSLRRDTRNWWYKEYKSRNFSFDVPQFVDTVILFDDESKYWVNGSKETIQFKGKTVLTVVPVKTGDRVNYGLGTIKVISKNETPT